MAHTSGEWVVKYGTNVVVKDPARGEMGRLIANTGSYSESGVGVTLERMEQVRSENEANAHLCAAAPDFYEAVNGKDPRLPFPLRPIGAVQALLAECEDWLSVAITENQVDDPRAAHEAIAEVREMITALKAATAKAEGGA